MVFRNREATYTDFNVQDTVGILKIIEGVAGGGVSRTAKKDIAARVSSKINWGYYWGYQDLTDIFLSYKTRLISIHSTPAPAPS